MTHEEKMRAALAVCESYAATDSRNAEFWRRLAGSLRKALTLLESE